MKLRLSHVNFNPGTQESVTKDLDWLYDKYWSEELVRYIQIIGNDETTAPARLAERKTLIKGILPSHIVAATRYLINGTPVGLVALTTNEDGDWNKKDESEFDPPRDDDNIRFPNSRKSRELMRFYFAIQDRANLVRAFWGACPLAFQEEMRTRIAEEEKESRQEMAYYDSLRDRKKQIYEYNVYKNHLLNHGKKPKSYLAYRVSNSLNNVKHTLRKALHFRL